MRAMAKTREPSSSRAVWRRPAADAEGHQRRHRVGGVRTVTPGIAARRSAACAANRQPAPVHAVEPDVHPQPADRSGHPDDRRPVVARRLEPPARRPPAAVPDDVDRSKLIMAAERRRAPARRAAADDEGAHPLGPQQPLLRRHGVHVRAGRRTGTGWRRPPARRRRATSAPRACASAAISAIGMTAPVVHSTCEIETSPCPLVIAASNASSIRVVVAVIADIDEHERRRRFGRAACTTARSRPAARGLW